MKFFQVSDGRSVKLCEIEAVERIDGMSCRLFTEYNQYEAKISYETIISILENYHDAEDEKSNPLLNEISQKVGNLGSFAG